MTAPTSEARSTGQYAFLEALPLQAAILDAQLRFVSCNSAWRRCAQELDRSWTPDGARFDAQDPTFARADATSMRIVSGIQQVARGARPLFEAESLRRGHGPQERRWFGYVATPLEGKIRRGVLVLRTDQTARYHDGERLRFLEFSIERAGEAIFWINGRGELLYVNELLCEELGYGRDELLEKRIWDVDPSFPEEIWLEHMIELRTVGSLVFESQHRAKNGRFVPVEISANYLDFGGEEYNFAFARNIEERKKAEAAIRGAADRLADQVASRTRELTEANAQLHEEVIARKETASELAASQERLALALWSADLGLWDVDLKTHTGTFDERWAQITGRNLEDIAPTLEGWLSLVHPDDRADLERSFRASRGDGNSVYEAEHRLALPSGEWRWFLARGRVVEHDAEGVGVRMTGTLQDVNERKALEEDLRQSHKMEAIGRLAGGVAHDFNNLLTAINGFADLVLRDLPPESSVWKKVQEIRKSGERASTLTNRLLAFGRKQVLQPRVLDLNRVITNMDSLLRPLIGEDIELVAELAPRLAPVKADLSQMEQVIVNLAVNARDAMPRGGKLTITTRTVPARGGRWSASGDREQVEVSITDTGTGMDAEVQAQVFDPFFTTKEQGQGTGLGLSMVYAIVQQSGGLVQIRSAVGEGTTVRVLLPRAAAGEGDESEEDVQSLAAPSRGDETVLLVEDEEAVRDLIELSLRDRGYNVLSAASGEEAEALLRDETRIDLLFTDVLLPGRTGAELAQDLQRRYPGLKVLFASGYAQDALGETPVLDSTLNFLQKPFEVEDAMNRVRQLLDMEEAEPGNGDVARGEREGDGSSAEALGARESAEGPKPSLPQRASG